MQTAKFPDRIVLTGSDEFEDNRLNSIMQMVGKCDSMCVVLCKRIAQERGAIASSSRGCIAFSYAAVPSFLTRLR